MVLWSVEDCVLVNVTGWCERVRMIKSMGYPTHSATLYAEAVERVPESRADSRDVFGKPARVAHSKLRVCSSWARFTGLETVAVPLARNIDLAWLSRESHRSGDDERGSLRGVLQRRVV